MTSNYSEPADFLPLIQNVMYNYFNYNIRLAFFQSIADILSMPFNVFSKSFPFFYIFMCYSFFEQTISWILLSEDIAPLKSE